MRRFVRRSLAVLVVAAPALAGAQQAIAYIRDVEAKRAG